MSTDTTQGWERRTDRGHRMTRIALMGLVLAVAICLITLLRHKEPPQAAVAGPPQVSPYPDVPQEPEGICSRGVVAPKVRVEIMPEVAGKVVYVHSQLHAGGLIRSNERIVQIDPAGYELAVRKAQAAVDEAQARVDLQRSAAGLRQLGDGEGQVALPAILQEPLIRQAEAALESAKADLALAELNLSRTSVVLPYEVLIAGQTVSLGQYAGVGQSLGLAYGTEAFEIEVSVRSGDLGRIGVAEGSATVEVKAVVAGRECVWSGTVVRATNEFDPTTGMTSVVVEVLQPMAAEADRPAMLPGMAVEVCFDGGRLSGTPDDAGNVGVR